MLRLATGGERGVYLPLGDGLKAAIERADPRVRVETLPTTGSLANIDLLDAGRADLALVQNDVAYYYARGERLYRFPSNKIVGLASLYTEVIHIIVRREAHVSALGGLRGKRIAVGERSSGTEFNAATILAAAGLSYADCQPQFLSLEDSGDALARGELDAAFVTAGVPAGIVERLAGRADLLPMDDAVLRKLRNAYPFFVATSIPADSYAGQRREVPAAGVRALLVARRDLGPEEALSAVKAVFEHGELLRAAHPVAASIELHNALRGMTLPLHPAPERYYEDRNVIKQDFSDYSWCLAFVAVAAALAALAVWLREPLSKAVRRSIWLQFGLLVGGLILAGGTALYFLERTVNDHFVDPPSTAWSIMVYMLSGFEDRAPITAAGRIVSVILIFLPGAGIVGAVAGKFASVFIRSSRARMPARMKHHIVICGWSQAGDRVVKELHASDAEPGTEVLIVAPGEVNLAELRAESAYRRVYVLRGDPVLQSVLRTARVHLAKSVVVLASDKEPDPDATSALVALGVSRWCEGRDRPRIVAELADRAKRAHLEDAGVDEIVCSADLGVGVLAQAAISPGTSRLYAHLLSYTEESPELYTVEGERYPREFVGKTFQQIASVLNSYRNGINPSILVGVRRGEEVYLNPRAERRASAARRFERLEAGDVLVVLAYSPPDLSSLDES